jgi:hypothetical protein
VLLNEEESNPIEQFDRSLIGEIKRKEKESNPWAMSPPWFSKPVANHQRHLPARRRVEESNPQVIDCDRFQDDLLTISRTLHRRRKLEESNPYSIAARSFSKRVTKPLVVASSWGDRRELNPLPLVSQTSPSVASGSVTVESRGIEPLTSRLQGERSSS